MTPPPAVDGGRARGGFRRSEQALDRASGVPEVEPEDAATPQPRSGAHPLTGWSAPPAVVPPSFSRAVAPSPGDFQPAPYIVPAEDFGQRRGGPAAPEPILHAPQTAEIFRDQRPRGNGSFRKTPFIVAALVLLAAGGAVVHFKVIPLEVLAVWSRPAHLSIDSQPAGASVLLDGLPLSGQTPLTVDVKRDRATHRIELTHPGYVGGETSLRFDRTVPLQATLRLEAEPPPPPPVEPPPAAASVQGASAESPGPREVGAGSNETLAGSPIAKHARSEQRASKGAHARKSAKARKGKSKKPGKGKSGKSKSKSAAVSGRAGKGSKGAHGADSAPSGELF